MTDCRDCRTILSERPEEQSASALRRYDGIAFELEQELDLEDLAEQALEAERLNCIGIDDHQTRSKTAGNGPQPP